MRLSVAGRNRSNAAQCHSAQRAQDRLTLRDPEPSDRDNSNHTDIGPSTVAAVSRARGFSWADRTLAVVGQTQPTALCRIGRCEAHRVLAVDGYGSAGPAVLGGGSGRRRSIMRIVVWPGGACLAVPSPQNILGAAELSRWATALHVPFETSTDLHVMAVSLNAGSGKPGRHSRHDEGAIRQGDGGRPEARCSVSRTHTVMLNHPSGRASVDVSDANVSRPVRRPSKHAPVPSAGALERRVCPDGRLGGSPELPSPPKTSSCSSVDERRTSNTTGSARTATLGLNQMSPIRKLQTPPPWYTTTPPSFSP